MKKIILILFLIIFPVFTQAAGLVPCGMGPEEDPCTFCHLFVLFSNVIQFIMFSFVPPVAVLMLVVGGIMYFFAGTSPSILKTATSIMTSVGIGLVIIFCSWIIINTVLVKNGIVNTTEGSPGESLLHWYEINCEW